MVRPNTTRRLYITSPHPPPRQIQFRPDGLADDELFDGPAAGQHPDDEQASAELVVGV